MINKSIVFSLCMVFSSSLLVGSEKNSIQIVSQSKLYEVALEKFRNKQYKESYELFNKLFESKMDDVYINFYLGRSAYELGEYEFAISAYDRILIKEPNNTRTRLEIAQTYMQMKLFAQSIKEFEFVLKDEKIPASIKKTVENKISFMKASLKTNFYNAMFMAGVIYDSNINGVSTVGAFDIYNPSTSSTVTVTNNDEEESTAINQGMARISHTKKFTDNYILTSSATAVLLKYNNHKEKDIHALSLSTSPSFLNKDYKYEIPITIDRVNQGHDSYQFNYYINPTYTKIINSSLLYSLGLKLGVVNYFEDETKNANVYELQNSLKYLTTKYGLFNIGINLGKELERNDGRTDISHKYFNFFASNSYEFYKNYSLLTSINYKKSNYIDTDVNFLTKREDEKYDYSFGIQKQINKNTLLNIGTTYSKQDSNHVSSEYNKHTYKANLLWNFNID